MKINLERCLSNKIEGRNEFFNFFLIFSSKNLVNR